MREYYVGTFAFSSDDIYHHGIKGQKWGVRRYQNEDGSLTDVGKRRYGTVENFKLAQEAKSAKKQANKDYNDFYKKSGYRTLLSDKNKMERDEAYSKWEKSQGASNKAAERYKNSSNTNKVKKAISSAKEKQREKISTGAKQVGKILGHVGMSALGAYMGGSAAATARRMGMDSVAKLGTGLMYANIAGGAALVSLDVYNYRQDNRKKK